jgi:uncharacterized protein YcbX
MTYYRDHPAVKITQLNIYPVKSLGGISLDEAELTPAGLSWDRRWMVVDDIGRFVTQRQLPAMAGIRVALKSDALVLSNSWYGLARQGFG